MSPVKQGLQNAFSAAKNGGGPRLGLLRTRGAWPGCENMKRSCRKGSKGAGKATTISSDITDKTRRSLLDERMYCTASNSITPSHHTRHMDQAHTSAKWQRLGARWVLRRAIGNQMSSYHYCLQRREASEQPPGGYSARHAATTRCTCSATASLTRCAVRV
jgi:hypothetical protein